MLLTYSLAQILFSKEERNYTNRLTRWIYAQPLACESNASHKRVRGIVGSCRERRIQFPLFIVPISFVLLNEIDSRDME